MSTLEIFLTVLSIISICCGVFFSIRAALRENKNDTKEDASQSTLIMYKLDNIDATVKDIKADSKAFRLDIQDARERILILEQEYKAWNPILTEIRKSGLYDKEDN